MSGPRIFFIHATRVSMTPVAESFARLWPEAQTRDLLDESLSKDLAEAGEMTDSIHDRIARLAQHAVSAGTDAILYTCSAFGPAIESARSDMNIPVLKPNEAMFEEALAGSGSLGLIATFAPSIPSMTDEFSQMAQRANDARSLETALVPEAMQRLADGDGQFHDDAIARDVVALADCETVMLAQFSMSRARALVEQRINANVLTSPDSAVAKLKALL